MRIKNQTQEEREINRLKEILFPKNKQPKKSSLKTFNSNDLYESETRRQSNLNARIHKETLHLQPNNQKNIKKLTKISHLDLPYHKQSSDRINQDLYEEPIQEQVGLKRSQILIKDEISKLKQEISTMLQKWTDEDRPSQDDKEYEKKIKTKLPKYVAINQEFQQSERRQEYTRRHYLENINKISENLQKYNSYMYGIKQAAQEVLSTIPVDRQQNIFPNPHLRAYKLYYLGMLLTNYFVSQIQKIRIYRLKNAFHNIYKASQEEKASIAKQKKKSQMNKGDFMFLRKNLLDKGFKKWRLNCELMKLNQAINPPIQNSLKANTSLYQSRISQCCNEKTTSINQRNSYTKNSQLLASEFLLKNILHKEKILQFLEEYLINSVKLSSSNLFDKQTQNKLNHQVQILLFDQQNNEMFSFVNQNDYLHQQMEGNIVKSRLYNVLDTMRDHSYLQGQPSNSEHLRKTFKKYSFQLKNSLTKMCIDCQKTIRMPEMKKNEVYSLQVDSSINEQIWIKASKTQRESRVNQTFNKKQPYITEEVFYEQKSIVENYCYHYENPNSKISAIFYPIIHQQSLIGLVRQYIYHTVPISISSFEFSYEELEFVTKSIFATFELSYSFEGLRKENDIVEKKYAIKVLKMIRKIQEELKNITSGPQSDKQTQNNLTKNIMNMFMIEMNGLLTFTKKQNKSGNLSILKQHDIDMLVYKLSKQGRQVNQLGENQSKIVFCTEEKMENEKFTKIYESLALDEKPIEEVLHQFYEQSRNKESNVSIVKQKLKVKEYESTLAPNQISTDNQLVILLVKTRSSFMGQQLYYMFLFNSSNESYNIQTNSQSKTLISYRFLEQLPPLQLLMDIVKKFSELFLNGLEDLKWYKQSLQVSFQNSIKQKKFKLSKKMRQFYLEEVKSYIFNQEQCEANGNQMKPHIGMINQFVQDCLSKFVIDIKNLHIPINFNEQSNIFCKIVHLCEMTLPNGLSQYNNKGIKDKKQCEKIYIQVVSKISHAINPSSDQSFTENSLSSQIEYNILTQDEYAKTLSNSQFGSVKTEQNQTGKPLNFHTQSSITLSFKVVDIKISLQKPNNIPRNSSNQSALSSDLINQIKESLTKQQIHTILSEIIQNYVSLTQDLLIQHKSTKSIQNKQNKLTLIQQVNQTNKNLQLQNKYQEQLISFTENIKTKIFEVFCGKNQQYQINGTLRSSNIINQNKPKIANQNKPKIQDTLQQVIEILDRVVKIMVTQQMQDNEQIEVEINENKVKFLIQKMNSYQKKNTSNHTNPSIKLQSQYHEVVSSSLIKLYQNLMNLISNQNQSPSKSQNTRNSDSPTKGDNYINLDVLGQIIKKSKSLKSHLKQLTDRNLVTFDTSELVQSNLPSQDKNALTHNQSNKSNSLQMNNLSKIVNSFYFTVNITDICGQTMQSSLQLITIKVTTPHNSSINSQSIDTFHSIQDNIAIQQQRYSLLNRSLQSVVKCIFMEYSNVFNWKRHLYKNQNIIKAFNLLIHGKQASNQISTEINQAQLNYFETSGLLMCNLSYAFNKIKSCSSNLLLKGSQLIKLSKLMQNQHKKFKLNTLQKWRSITGQIKHIQRIKILKEKVVSDPQTQKQKISTLIKVIGKTLVYKKTLWKALTKINFYAKHNRIKDFNQYRLKCLDIALQHLNQTFIQSSNKQMKKFLTKCLDIQQEKKREEFFTIQKMKLFVLRMQNSSLYKRKIALYVKQSFNIIKNTYLKSKQPQVSEIQTFQLKQRHISLDEKITQSTSIEKVSQILSKEFSSYYVWVKPIKKYDEFILLSKSHSEIPKQQELLSGRNLSFDQSSIMQSRINSITNIQKISQNTKLSKQQLFQMYPEDKYSFLQTSQTMFISKNSFTLPDLLSSGPLQLGQTINSSTNGCSFKQKDKLHSLAKILAQFFSNYKIQFNIKITYLDAIYETMKVKRFSYALKKWRKYTDNLRLLATCQLTDTIYELNVETQNVKQKLKIQQKEISDQRSQYNKLLKKESQHKNRIQKYSANIQILSKMLEHYQSTRKQEEEQIMRSASKSSKKYNRHSYEPLVDILSLSEEERNVILMTLTKWRQVNASDKLKELRARNLSKQVKHLTSCMSQSWKIMSRTVMLDSFQQIISYSIYVTQLRQQRQREQKLRQQRIQKQREQRLERQRAERQKFQIQRKQIEQIKREMQLRKQKQISNNKWKNQTTQISASKIKMKLEDQKLNQMQQIKDVSDSQEHEYDDSQMQYFNDYTEGSVRKKSISHSLAEQLEDQFNQLNRRLVTFQKNHGSPTSQTSEISVDNYFNSYETSQADREISREICSQIQEKGLEQYKAPNNTVDLMPKPQKMTEEEKIRFQLQRMKMKKPQFNKENLTVTKQEYEKVNGGASYKLGGKTLRFLKRMGKLQTSDRNSK